MKLVALSVSFLLIGILSSANADILVGQADGKIAKFRNDGSLVNAAFITGAVFPSGILVTSSNILVAYTGNDSVAKYNLDGSVANASFITGLQDPTGLATDGTLLYVAQYTAGTIMRYLLTTGAAFSPSFITGLNHPTGLILANGKLFVANSGADNVVRYSTAGVAEMTLSGLSGPTYLAQTAAQSFYVANAVTGVVGEYAIANFAPVNASLVSNLQSPQGLLILGSTFAVVNLAGNSVRTFTSSGTSVNPSFITGLNAPVAVALTTDDTPYPAPTITISGRKKVTTTKSAITLKGTSTEATSVVVKVGKAGSKTARGTSTWTARTKLKPGRNVVAVTARGKGGISRPAKVTVLRR